MTPALATSPGAPATGAAPEAAGDRASGPAEPPARGAPGEIDARCDHCAAPLGQAEAPVVGADGRYCCHGCAAVAALLRAEGLDREYYRLLAATAPEGTGAGAGAPSQAGGAPTQVGRAPGRRYAEMDEDAFHALYVRPAGEGRARTELWVEGARCAACVWLLERLPRVVPGVVSCRLDLGRSMAEVTWEPARTTLSAVARGVHGLGYPAHPYRGVSLRDARRREDRAALTRIAVAGALAGNVMLLSFALYGGAFSGMEPAYAALFRWTALALTVPAVLGPGQVFLRGAWAGLRTRALHMDLPISLGLLAGLAWGAWNTWRGAGEIYFDTVTVLIFLLLTGRWLERRAQRRASDAAELLHAVAPSVARRVERADAPGDTPDDASSGAAGGAREVPVEALAAGDLVEVRAGDPVPVDGVVTHGRTELDLSLLTGESRPQPAGPGAAVHAGTLNLAARVVVRVTETGERTRVGRLMRLVEEQARRRAPIVRLADRIAGAFVAAVLVLAAVTVALWWGAGPDLAIDHAVALLVVTCPCALGMATPLAVSVALGRAARAGAVVRGGEVLERLVPRGRLWLDKTGTITTGAASADGLRLVAWDGPAEVAPLVLALERGSAHPLARAFARAFAAAPPADGPEDASAPGSLLPVPVPVPVPGPAVVPGPRPPEGASPPGSLSPGPTDPFAPPSTWPRVAGPLPACDGPARRGAAGLEGRVAGRRVRVGSPAWVAVGESGPESTPAEVPAWAAARIAEHLAGGRTPVAVAVDGPALEAASPIATARKAMPSPDRGNGNGNGNGNGKENCGGCELRVVAVAAFADRPRPEAATAIARLRAQGWRVGVLSGDHPEVVRAVAREVGVDPADALGGLSPEDKLARVVADRAAGPVVMVGDGVNDAAALAAATVGVGVHGGAEATLAAADVFLVRPDLGAVADLVDGADHTWATIRRGLAVSLAYNVVGAGLAISGVITPWLAAVLMPLSSVSVVLAASRAGRPWRRPALAAPVEAPPCR